MTTVNDLNCRLLSACNVTYEIAADLSSILDWWQDSHARTISVDNMPGKVHEGFYSSVQNIWKPLTSKG
jgi:hypothetical protein